VFADRNLATAFSSGSTILAFRHYITVFSKALLRLSAAIGAQDLFLPSFIPAVQWPNTRRLDTLQ
jgi:hypothetical protein